MPRSKNEKFCVREALGKLREAAVLVDSKKARAIELAIELGRWPKPGCHLVRNVRFGTVCEEADGTPFTCSVGSETYWCR